MRRGYSRNWADLIATPETRRELLGLATYERAMDVLRDALSERLTGGGVLERRGGDGLEGGEGVDGVGGGAGEIGETGEAGEAGGRGKGKRSHPVAHPFAAPESWGGRGMAGRLHSTRDYMIAYHNVTGKGVRAHRDRTHEVGEEFVFTAIYYFQADHVMLPVGNATATGSSSSSSSSSMGAVAAGEGEGGNSGDSDRGGDRSGDRGGATSSASSSSSTPMVVPSIGAQESRQRLEHTKAGLPVDGELRVRLEPSHFVEDVVPVADRLVLLRTVNVLHQVNPVLSERFSLTSWFSRKLR